MKKLLHRLYHFFFYNLHLKSKFLITHLLLAMVPALVIAIFTYGKFSALITDNTLRNFEAISEQTATNLEGMMAQITSVVDAVSEQDFLMDFLQTEYEVKDRGTTAAASSYFSLKAEDIHTFLDSTNYIKDSHVVSAIRIYMDEAHLRQLRHYTGSTLFASLSETTGTYWHGIFTHYDQSTLICPTMYLSPSELDKYGDMAIIRKIWLGNDRCAFIAVYFHQDSINSFLLSNNPFSTSAIYIINERQAIVATTSPTLSGTYFMDYEDIPERLKTTQRLVRQNFAGESVYAGYKRISGTEWYMVTVIPAGNITSEGTSILLEFLLLYGLFLLISIAVSIALSSSVINRLSNVIHQMKNVRFGPPKLLPAEESTDEIGELVDTYNYMSAKINSLLEEQIRAAEELRMSEFNALQAQINPHFLYNTLDMINWQAQSGQTREVSEAVQLLSRFYKLTLNKGNNVVPLRDELEHADLYMRLQNMRYDDKIDFVIDVPEDMLDCTIPKLVFQPIVENALLHGILEKEDRSGTIVIAGWREDPYLVFVVSDDGVGISPEKLSTILTGEGQSKKGSNIGVYNTHRRLQLYYDETCGLTYRSEEGEMTEVEIRIYG